MKNEILRTIGSRHAAVSRGPIANLISPSGLGESLKPFVFLDFFSATVTPGFGFDMHPHSGIATLTWQPGCDVQYTDTTGQAGLLKAGGLEWMNAGGGAWHQGWLQGSGPSIGFQLWVPLPPEIEDGCAFGQYVPPEKVPFLAIPGGDVKVLLGWLDSGKERIESPIDSHQDMNYLVLSLETNHTWSHRPPPPHSIAWAFAFQGAPLIQGIETDRELLVLEGSGEIEIRATGHPARVLIGTGKPHPFPLVRGASSIHTNSASLAKGKATIDRIGAQLQRR